MTHCEKCGLQYTSYCIGCEREMTGIGVTLPEYIKEKAERDKGREQHDHP